MNISAVKLHNDKLDDIKDRLKTIEVVVNEVYLEDIKLDDSGVKEVKVADIQSIRKDIQNIYDFILNKESYNKHRVWRMLTELIDKYDKKLCA